MGQLSSGGNFAIRQPGEAWVSLDEAYLMEASTYEWKFAWSETDQIPYVHFCGLPLSYRQINGEMHGTIQTPFQSGHATFNINGDTQASYIYPDARKMTQEQYSIMLSDILNEAALCFDYSGLDAGIETDKRTRELSWAQWSYLEMSFSSLVTIIQHILPHPTRMLVTREQEMRRDRIKTVYPSTLVWLDRHIGRSATASIPEKISTSIREDSYNTYENRVIKRQLLELRYLLKLYMSIHRDDRGQKAEEYADKVGYWLRDPFFKEVQSHQGPIHVTQVFRKHPVYRQCYQWFDRLYKHGNERIGFESRYPLKETFALYEIWCYMQLVKIFREKGLLKDSSGLYKTSREGLFLNFAEHNESVVRLNNGMRLYYQRVYQYNSPYFYTFTQQMKPDIVIESGERLYILDPKYRVAANLGTALGEMHKYRDGILVKHNDERAVEQVFIITPVHSNELRYFSKEFQEKYKMGAIELAPGATIHSLQEWVDEMLDIDLN